MTAPDTQLKSLLQAVANTATPLALMKDEKIIYVNKAFSAIYGACNGKTFADFFDSENLDQLQWLLAGKHKESDKIVLPLKETLDCKTAGTDVLVQIWPLDNPYCLMSLQENYSLQRLADIDELTRLPNRRKAMMLLDIEKARADRSLGFCLTMADIDHFKSINDTFGHAVGDMVLREVSRIMMTLLRGGDWVARWGGEEFIIFTIDNDVVTGMQPIERIRRQLEETTWEGMPQLKVTMSFGLAAVQGKSHDVRGIIAKADMLLYEAKNNGRNRIEVESEGDAVWVGENIRKVINDGQLMPLFLPLLPFSPESPGASAPPPLRTITPCLRGYPYSETEKMLGTAKRLAEQKVLIYRHLLQIIDSPSIAAAAGFQPNQPYYFPLFRNLYNNHVAEVDEFLNRHPLVYPGIDAEQPLPEALLQKITALGRPLVLFNVDTETMPSYLLGLPQLAYVVFSQPASAEGVLSLLAQNSVQCYASLHADVGAEEKQRLKEAGFTGVRLLPAADETPYP